MNPPTDSLRIRPAAVAGRFYPKDADELRAAVRKYIDAAPPASAVPPGPVRAIIAPHAGYIYSGPIAGAAYAALAPLRGRIDTVVLIGPAHYVPFTGIAASGDDAFATPLGTVQVNRAAVAAALTLPFVQVIDEAHAPEHGLEVHLPFLQVALGAFTLAPFLCGDCSGAEAARLIDLLCKDERTLLVVSSDLSHYHDYDKACDMDRATQHAIEKLDPHAIAADQACGRVAIQGLLLVAAQRGLKIATLDLRSSGDTAGGRDRVVGYGAWVAA